MLANVRRITIEPLMKSVVLPGILIYTDEYGIYNRLSEWGDKHKSLNHGAGEYARDEDGDGFYEVHVNDGRLLVSATWLVASTSRNLTGEAPVLSWLF